MPPDDPLLQATGYARRGWPVLPVWWPLAHGACACGRPDCSKPGKHPLSRHGFRDASTDPAVVRRWWARWPNANVDPPGESYMDKVGRLNMARLRAEELVLRETVLLPAEPGIEEDDEATGA